MYAADMSCSLNVVSRIHDIQYVEDFLEELHREDQTIVDKGNNGNAFV